MNIGIIGLGKMGTKHLNELSKNENFKIKALYDTKKMDFDYPFYDDIEAFLKTDLDCVIIASPTYSHLDLAKNCIKTVKTVLVEKPLALNLEQMLQLQEEAKKEEALVAVGFSERFNPSIVSLKEELKDDKILSINIRRFSPYPSRITDVGILQDLSVHDLDLLLFFLGKKPSKTQLFKLNVRDKNREDEAVFSLCFDESIALVHQSWNSRLSIRTLELISENAIYQADLLNFTLKKNGNSIPLRQSTPLQGEHNALLNLIQNRSLKQLASLEDSITIQELLESK